MKFYDLPNLIENLVFDGDIVDYRLHFDNYFKWGAETKEQYEAIEKEIDSYEFFGQGFEIYMWCDISGYDYWMNQQQEQNYIQITVAFDSENFDEKYIESLKNGLKMAEKFAEDLEIENSFSPLLNFYF